MPYTAPQILQQVRRVLLVKSHRERQMGCEATAVLVWPQRLEQGLTRSQQAWRRLDVQKDYWIPSSLSERWFSKVDWNVVNLCS